MKGVEGRQVGRLSLSSEQKFSKPREEGLKMGCQGVKLGCIVSEPLWSQGLGKVEFGLYRQVDPLNSVLKTVLLLEIKFLIRKEARVLFSWEKGENFQLRFFKLIAEGCCNAAVRSCLRMTSSEPLLLAGGTPRTWGLLMGKQADPKYCPGHSAALISLSDCHGRGGV